MLVLSMADSFSSSLPVPMKEILSEAKLMGLTICNLLDKLVLSMKVQVLKTSCMCTVKRRVENEIHCLIKQGSK